jgi:hypothetical protein
MRRYLLLFFLLLVACEGPKPLQIESMITPTIVVRTPYHQDPLDTSPTPMWQPAALPTEDTSTRPATHLPDSALAAFGPDQELTLDVHGRYYTLGECRANYCLITLWPDNAKVWTTRETLGLSAYVPPTPVPLPPTPVPYCANVNGFEACGTLDNRDAVDAEARQKYLNSLPAQQLPEATAEPAKCSACPTP